jgi:hypothetical protein
MTITATGGDYTEINEGGTDYGVHTFLGSANFTVTAGSGDVEILLVGGGAAGGRRAGGGGGSGGVILKLGGDAIAVTPTGGPTSNGIYPIVIGAGSGSGSNTGASGAGSPSTALDLTALGGGPGGHFLPDSYPTNCDGGSGGGRGNQTDSAEEGVATQPGSASGGYGNDAHSGGYGCGGGAGGAGTGTAGGVGLQSSINGTATYYAGGGARNSGTGGLGGGGSGNEGHATANTGGGGGGGNNTVGQRTSGAGGSGICIIRYELTGAPPAPTTRRPRRYNRIGRARV